MAPNVKIRLEVEGSAEAVAAVRAFTAQAKSAGKDAATSFGALGSAGGAINGAVKMFGTLAGAVAVVQLKNFIADTVRLATEQADLAASLGTTVGRFSALSAAARTSGTDASKLGAGLGALADRIDDLRSGTPEATRAFARFGLTASDFRGEDIAKHAETLSAAMRRLGPGLTAGALAADVMGKNGRALIPVMQKLGELGGLAGATEFAKKTGAYVDKDSVARLKQITDRMALIGEYARGAALQFAEAFGPGMVKMLDALIPPLEGTKGVISVLGEVLGALADGMGRLVLHTYAWGVYLGDLATGKFAKAAEDWKRGGELLKAYDEKRTTPAAGSDLLGTGDAGAAFARAQQVLSSIAAARNHYYDAQLSMLQAYRAREEAIDKRAYEQGRLSLEEYFARRRKRLEEDAQYRIDRLEREITEARKIANEEQRTYAVGALNAKIVQISQDLARAEAELDAEFADARTRVSTLAADVRGGLLGALTEAFTSGANQARNLNDWFIQLTLSIARMAQQLAAVRIATSIVDSIPGLAVKKAAGGMILGPGTGTSDSIPAWLSNGEYVMPASRVAQPGVYAALEALRRGELGGALFGASTPLRARRGYADGGLVSPAAPAGQASIGGEVRIGLDDGLVLRALDTPAGQRVLLKIVSKAPRAFGSALRR